MSRREGVKLRSRLDAVLSVQLSFMDGAKWRCCF